MVVSDVGSTLTAHVRILKRRCMKYWEIIADNLSKAGWSWTVSKPLIVRGERSGLQKRSGDRKRFILRADEKLSAFLELESGICDFASSVLQRI